MNRRSNISQRVMLVSILMVISSAAFQQTGANAKLVQSNSLNPASVSSKNGGSIVRRGIDGPSSLAGFHGLSQAS